MSTHKSIDKICVIAIVCSLIITILFMNGSVFGIEIAEKNSGYAEALFNTEAVHTIDIVIDDWDDFISTAQSEEYSVCSVVIDGEAVNNVGIRGKGNTSLSNVASMDSERYSFKIEFDHYDSSTNYYGLDKLSLNNIIQDNTYMKDYLVYQMMAEFGVNSPLCSYVYITVNGEDWGLYLAVEGIEDAFLQRNYGKDYGELYKPDSMSFGGGRGNGKAFDMSEFSKESFGTDGENAFENMPTPDSFTENFSFNEDDMQKIQESVESFMNNSNFEMPDMGKIGGMGSSDVKLQYIDDDPDSYGNIFDNAKTDVTQIDKERLISSLKQLSEYDNIEEVVDVDEVLRYFVVHNFVVNYDSYTGSMIHNYYLYEENGQLSMIPWDYNLAFGTFMGGNASSAVNDAIDEALTDRPMQAWIFSDEKYTEQYHELYAEMLETVDIQGIINNAYELISPYVQKDPTSFCTHDEFAKGVDTLKQFCELRTKSVQYQLDGDDTSVDTEDLSLSDMGTMNNRGGFNKGNTSNTQNRGEIIMPENMGRPEEMTMPENMEIPEDMSMPEGMTMPENMEMPDGSKPIRDEAVTEVTGNNTEVEANDKSSQRHEMTQTPSFDNMSGDANGSIQTDMSSILLLIASVATLIIGIIIAARFKRRR